MARIRSAIAALAAVCCVSAATAAPVAYQGTFASGVAVAGSVGGTSWIDETATSMDFWRFSGLAGQQVNIGVTRGVLAFDPVFSLYFGTTNADEALFLNDADWGGLLFLTVRDDEVPSAGPGGDPALVSYILPFSGLYTVAIGGFDSDTSGPYPYSALFTIQAVPEPGTVALIAVGLIGVGWLRRRSTTPTVA